MGLDRPHQADRWRTDQSVRTSQQVVASHGCPRAGGEVRCLAPRAQVGRRCRGAPREPARDRARFPGRPIARGPVGPAPRGPVRFLTGSALASARRRACPPVDDPVARRPATAGRCLGRATGEPRQPRAVRASPLAARLVGRAVRDPVCAADHHRTAAAGRGSRRPAYAAPPLVGARSTRRRAGRRGWTPSRLPTVGCAARGGGCSVAADAPLRTRGTAGGSPRRLTSFRRRSGLIREPGSLRNFWNSRRQPGTAPA